ncbi:SubName: Full=Uncharacterized protein {ECO:0000313/EMBL:CCA73435.1} [Serendipita indica DSM 11827]|uniref:DUF300-domain-containing protein n=1 Tax=Serendipita indica (strain DSM 11827) TaxID=1109443 RepID=G4TQ42_SERID|nr:SubName: Full=Uncharacterized protein {ECO:0000313/EMBL:CCA73435.1} [Serendipita indica DSM 11827]CCA73435.1 hypothetical protein PIIN_07389 [Serendipita indica DSM 11827]
MVARCAEDNTAAIDQSSFWDENGIHWTYHRIGWAIAGGCAILTVIITIFSVLGHARHYYVRAEQRQIIRILYMPAVFAIISFFSYRFFRDYVYYSLVEIIYEAFVISAFLLLIIQYVAATAASRTAEDALARKDKTKLPIPCCCLRYRPTKPYFMYTLKWSVMQYTIIRPGKFEDTLDPISKLQPSVLYCRHHHTILWMYIEAIDFVSISVALMGLIIFYDLTKHELNGRRPLAKFLCIKLIVMVTWYQGFVFSILQNKGIIKATEFWTSTNIADGLNALATCIEMVIFALFMWWAYPVSEYLNKSDPNTKEGGYVPTMMTDDEMERRRHSTTSIWRPLWDSINYADMALEVYGSWVFFWDYATGKPHARSSGGKKDRVTFGTAFGLEEDSPRRKLVKPSRSKNQANLGLVRIRTPASESETYPSDARGADDKGQAYRMLPVTTQPRPRETPSNGYLQQPDSPQTINSQTRWSSIGVAI